MKQDQIVVAIIALAVVLLLFRSCSSDDPTPVAEPDTPATVDTPAEATPTDETPAIAAADDDDAAAADDDDSAVVAEPETPAVAPGVARIGAGDAPTGPAAVGRDGDVVLTSPRGVRFVVTDIGHRTGFQETGGNLVDIVVPGGQDVFDGMSTWFDRTFPRQGAYTQLSLDEAGAVTASGTDSGDDAVAVSTTWRILPEDDDRVLARLGVSTTITNGGDAPLEDFDLGDIVGWGGLRHFAPGFGRHLAGEKDPLLPWVGGEAADHAVLVVSTGPMTGPHGSSWSDPVWRAETIAAGGAATYDRQVLVGASIADLLPAAAALQNAPTATLTVQVRDAQQNPIAGARVELRSIDKTTAVEAPAVVGTTGADGTLTTVVPPGEYKVIGSSASRRPLHTGRLELAAGDEAEVPVVASGEGRLAVSTNDANGIEIPARYRVEGVGSTPDPDFGPTSFAIGGNRAHATGPITLLLPPGTYDVSVTAGPAWSLRAERVEVLERQPGDDEVQAFDSTLTQVVPTDGWRLCDFHQHAAYSADSAVPPIDGIIASVAEGLDCIATTDHDAVADWTADLEASGLADRVLWLPGVEVTSEVVGHFNVFPWDPALGVPDHFDKSAAEVATLLRATAPDAVVQINHPRWGRIGMWDIVGIDDRTGLLRDADDEGAPTGATYDVDAVEVLNGTDTTEAEEVLASWLRMVDAGKEATILGNSDSHSLVDQPRGSARTWVHVGDDASVDAVVSNLRERRRATATTGPFLDIEAAPSSVDHKVVVTMRAPAWMPVDTVELLGGDPVGNAAWSLGTWTAGSPGLQETVEGGLRTWRIETHISADGSDGWVIAIARGDAPMEPWSEATALAVTNVVRLTD